MVEYGQVIDIAYLELSKSTNNRDFGDDAKMLGLLGTLKEALYGEIYTVLMPKGTKEAETQIRDLIRKHIIGYKLKNNIYIGALDITKKKIDLLSSCKVINHDTLSQYMGIYDDLMAMASLRSFKHFCLYLETDFPKKIWQFTQNIFDGWFFYANQMVLDGKVQFIEKQLPTSYGKSISDVFLIAWIFGLDCNNDVLKIFGSKYNCSRAFDSIVELMLNKRYAKIFPYYAQFQCKQELMFETCKQKDGEFKISGSKRPVNLLIVGKESKIGGVRAKYLFIDDITQAEDAGNIKSHNKDIYNYENIWFKRSYSNKNFYVVASGTTYSVHDILTYLKARFGHNSSVISKVNQYTSVAESDQITKKGISVFICVPKLDYKTDESTYPLEFPTEKARKQREDDYEMFMAMEQQLPVKPKDNPFYFSTLLDYDTLPEIGTNGRSECHWAYLDSKRKGKDYCAMPICSYFNNKHYLVDVLYDDKPMKELYTSIINKIIQRHITILWVEVNVDTSLKTLLEKLLLERGITFCKIMELYNTENKDVRISNTESDVKNNIVFPKMDLYARSSPIGQAMEELYSYSYVKKVDYDDFTDAISGYSKCFIGKAETQYGTVMTFRR